MNKKLFYFALAGVCATAVVGTAVLSSSMSLVGPTAGDTDYNLTLNASPSEIGGDYSNFATTYTTENGNGIGFAFNQAKAVASGLCNIAAGGSIKNTTALSGVKSVTVKFDGTLTIKGSLDSTVEYVDLGSVASETKLTFDKSYDYLDLVAGAETTITNINFEYSCTSRAQSYETVRYEAEDALVRVADWNFDGAIIYDERASGGTIIGNLWQGVTFHINHYAYFQGNHTIKVHYVNGFNNQKVCYGVNGGKNMLDVPAQVEGSWDFANASDVELTVNLRAGWNDIVFGITDAGAQYDYFEVVGSEKKYDPADYEMAVSNKMFYAVEAARLGNANRANDWNGPYFAGSGMGLTNDEGNGLELTFTNMKAGNYNFKMVYGTGGAFNFKMVVNNGTERSLQTTDSGGWNVLGNKTFQVTFKDGTNTIKILRDGTWLNFNAFFATIK
ncbi:MAG: hypothetical protein MJ239_01180 [Bacilli bacterium]|nr:hypothetical protein [Bacilli bacterium]